MKPTFKLLLLFLLVTQMFGYGFQSTLAAEESTTYYVDKHHPQAQDVNDHGTIDTPWKTLNYAFMKLKPGDTLLVREGVYTNSSITLTDKNSGQENAPITVKSYPGETVILDNGQTIRLLNVQWWIFDGFIFQNFNNIIYNLGREDAITKHIVIRNSVFRDSKNDPVSLLYAEDILIENNFFSKLNSGQIGVGTHGIDILRFAHKVVIRNNKFVDISADGIHMGATTDPQISNITVEYNKFLLTSDQVEWGENGIDIKTVQGPITIRNNYFRGFRPVYPDGIGYKGGALGEALVIHMGAQNVLIEGNYFEDNSVHTAVADHQDKGFQPTQNIRIINNVFKDARYYEGNNFRPPGQGIALKVKRIEEGMEIYHNIFIGNTINLYSEDTQIGIFKNNAVIQGSLSLNNSDWSAGHNAWSQIQGRIPAKLKGEADLYISDPKINNDFRPLPDSDLINAGQNVGIKTDFDGRPRLDGQPDLGAFEAGEGQPFGTYLEVFATPSTVYPGDTLQVELIINDADNMYGLQVACRANPSVLTLQSAEFGNFFTDPLIGAREIDSTTGTWFGVLSRKHPAPALSGSGLFATLTFNVVASGEGVIDCTPLASDINGHQLPILSTNNTVQSLNILSPEEGATIAGSVTYQGRTDHANISVTAVGAVNRLVQTNNSGQFEIDKLESNEYSIRADGSLYLPSCITISVSSNEFTNLNPATLIGGDTDDDDIISISDAALIGSNFGLSQTSIPAMDFRADLNSDGQVNIQDLSILAGNFGKQGCQDWLANSGM